VRCSAVGLLVGRDDQFGEYSEIDLAIGLGRLRALLSEQAMHGCYLASVMVVTVMV
jgi:hypothetical protein